VPGADLPAPAGKPASIPSEAPFVPVDSQALQGGSSVLPWVTGAGVVVLVIALGAVPAAVRRRSLRRRLADGSPGALWEELLATTADLRITVPRTATARQLARQLAEQLGGAEPAAVPALRTLALAQERAVYGPPGPGTDDPSLPMALRSVRRALLRRASRAQRLRAALWPASTVLEAAGWLTTHAPRRVRAA
jgi:hypothetical protein